MYQVLYRKWRPRTFRDVVGQPQVTVTLEGEVAAGRLSHAYLFTGSRGTGKTSCAKILSKAVNCLAPQEGNPCNECEICRGIDSGAILDVVEIDAASNRGIDDIRALRDESVFTPARTKYRVYIIDEVHMLTIEAFNALLKTLEEPEQHVIFILATTEVQKLPSTILSRCQRFDFRRIEPEAIAQLLVRVAEREGAVLDFDAAMLIARVADGAARDAYSLLDRCLAGGLTQIDAAAVRDAAGLVGRDHLFELSCAVRERDGGRALRLTDALHKASFDAERLCTELVNHFRDIMIVKSVGSPEDLIVCTKDEMARLQEHAAQFSLEEVLRAIEVLGACGESLRRSRNGRIEVEMALLRLCSPELDTNASALLARVAALEQGASVPQNAVAVTAVSGGAVAPMLEVVPKAEPMVEAEFVREEIPLPEAPPEMVHGESSALQAAPPFKPDTLPFAQAQAEEAPVAEDAFPFGGEVAAAPFDDDDFEAPAADAVFVPPAADVTPVPAPPPFMQANFAPAQTSGDACTGVLCGRVWDDLCAEIVRLCPPMTSMVKGASAELRGDVLLFRTPNPLVNMLLSSNADYCNAVSCAVKNVMQKDVGIRVEQADK